MPFCLFDEDGTHSRPSANSWADITNPGYGFVSNHSLRQMALQLLLTIVPAVQACHGLAVDGMLRQSNMTAPEFHAFQWRVVGDGS